MLVVFSDLQRIQCQWHVNLLNCRGILGREESFPFIIGPQFTDEEGEPGVVRRLTKV